MSHCYQKQAVLEALPDLCFDFVQHSLQAVSVPGQAAMMQLLAFLHFTFEASYPCFLFQDSLQHI